MPLKDIFKMVIFINIYCYKLDIDPDIIMAIFADESDFYPRAISPKEAKGLGQIMPANFVELGIKQPFDILENVRGTIFHLYKELRSWKIMNQRQLELTLAAYNEGYPKISWALRHKKWTYGIRVYAPKVMKSRQAFESLK